MKRIVAFLLILTTFVAVVACANTPNNDIADESSDAVDTFVESREIVETIANETETVTETLTETVTETLTETVTEKIESDSEFLQVGYSRVDITPDEPVYLDESTLLDKVIDPIYATCVAVNDGENTVLLYTLDVKNIGPEESAQIRVKTGAKTKISSKNIIISTTHNHSAPKLGTLKDKTANLNWTNKVHNAIIQAANEAIADLSDATIYTATGKTTGMAFVRRYLLADGTYTGIHNGNKSKAAVVDYETEADDTVQIIRFVRDDKKDVLMANWQAHVAHAIGVHPNSITSDLVGFARDTAESLDEDVLFALYVGASGNINLTAKVPGTKKYNDYTEVGVALGTVIIESCSKMEEVSAGKINVSAQTLKVEIRKDDTATVKKANELYALGESAPNYKTLLENYGFNSKYEVSSIVNRNNAASTSNFYIAAFSFGDLGFVSVPYEMFDTNGMQVKDGSPFKTTFVLTNAEGWGAYIPSADAIPHGGYEVYTTRYVFGTAERMVEELLGMLKEQAK